MSYIGRGLDAISNVEKLDNITFDGSATYALEKSSVAYTPSGANNILISIDGVVQMGNFSVSTTNIVFDWSPTSSNTCDWILHIGVGVLNIPADGSIVAAKMAANSVDSDSYVDGSIDTAHIDALQVTGAKLNTDVISAQTELAAEPADADEFMVSDGGVLKRIDYSLIKGGGITMTDSWKITAQVNVATDADITTNWERDDTSGAGFIGTGLTESSGIFTFPQTGIYQIFYTMNITTSGTDSAFFLHLKTSIDGTNYISHSIICNGYIAGDQITSSVDTIFDVTNTTNCKFKFYTDNFTTGTSVYGDTNMLRSGFNVIRLGDT
jgi:hypothetical protein